MEHKNTNFINKDGLVYNVYAGDQTVETLKKAYTELLVITTKLRKIKNLFLSLLILQN